MTHAHSHADGGFCPLCGQPNGCAIPAGEDPYDCWCMTARIPQDLRDRVPADRRGKACICRNCLDAYKKEHSKV
ncbi:MAG: hypothetical protein K0Q90_4319 [Paenibacillaceae bacterium]|nr:hypothetical protein [Paenibacillaceae bacterium]